MLDCASGWKYFTKTRKCYKYSSTERTRADSIKSCKAATDNPTANLVSIRDLDTNNYVNTLSSSKFWIGAYKSSSGWTWPDGYKALLQRGHRFLSSLSKKIASFGEFLEYILENNSVESHTSSRTRVISLQS